MFRLMCCMKIQISIAICTLCPDHTQPVAAACSVIISLAWSASRSWISVNLLGSGVACNVYYLSNNPYSFPSCKFLCSHSSILESRVIDIFIFYKNMSNESRYIYFFVYGFLCLRRSPLGSYWKLHIEQEEVLTLSSRDARNKTRCRCRLMSATQHLCWKQDGEWSRPNWEGLEGEMFN